jgi:cysteinyl-tRNA synthetase
MGHARAYLSFDILRRILESHFGYDVLLVMNVTNIDDKIIQRAAESRRHHLELASHYEREFHRDMAALGVLPATVVTRVTEYMSEIVDYIAAIVDGGYAYGAGGSVYFDVAAFESSSDGGGGARHYCKLAPEQILNAELLAEGEGRLAATREYAGDKRSPRDFALWKRSKGGEPAWPSPWGPGRPGWHIECSVMASDVLEKLTGSTDMDVHSGGVDLKFPHHDNEMAQAEARTGTRQWVNYFVHAGHLHIRGLKMSKSLKNFITIQEALKMNTARQIRMLFLLHKYNAQMDYGDNTMQHALETEKRLTEFFHNVKAALRDPGTGWAASQKWSDEAVELQRSLAEAQKRVDAALKDDFDTPTAMNVLTDLVKQTNVYLDSGGGNGGNNNLQGLVLRNAAGYVTRMLRVFGLMADDPVGWTTVGGGGGEGGGGGTADRETVLRPVLDAVQEFRSTVRDGARAGDTGAVLTACDDFRDRRLPPLGIRLEDKPSGSVWKLADDPEELMREMEQKEAEAERRAEEKRQREAAAAQKDALNRLSPADFMKQLTLEDGTPMYGQFDEATGLPTHDAAGEPLNKNQTKKAQKTFANQQKKYDKYLASQEQP